VGEIVQIEVWLLVATGVVVGAVVGSAIGRRKGRGVVSGLLGALLGPVGWLLVVTVLKRHGRFRRYPAGPEPGWYYDIALGETRWWDGSAWVDEPDVPDLLAG